MYVITSIIAHRTNDGSLLILSQYIFNIYISFFYFADRATEQFGQDVTNEETFIEAKDPIGKYLHVIKLPQ